jgi:hypothetical protein
VYEYTYELVEIELPLPFLSLGNGMPPKKAQLPTTWIGTTVYWSNVNSSSNDMSPNKSSRVLLGHVG